MLGEGGGGGGDNFCIRGIPMGALSKRLETGHSQIPHLAFSGRELSVSATSIGTAGTLDIGQTDRQTGITKQ